MPEDKRTVKTCTETKVVQTHRVFPSDLNHHATLFGGKLMSLIDDTASISVSRFARNNSIVTASMDKLDFLHPIHSGHSVCVETYVTGAGNTSVEVFAKVMGEDLVTGERYIGATSFISFVVVKEHEDELIKLPQIQPETTEEKMVCEGYEMRRQKRLADRDFNIRFAEAVSMLPPWLDEKEDK